MRKTPHALVAQVNDRAFRAGVRISEMLRGAGVAQSTWLRWANEGVSPKAETIDRCNAALDELLTPF